MESDFDTLDTSSWYDTILPSDFSFSPQRKSASTGCEVVDCVTKGAYCVTKCAVKIVLRNVLHHNPVLVVFLSV